MYRNLVTYAKGGLQYIWQATWDQNGKRVEEETTIDPYLYFEDKNADGTYKSIFNKPLTKKVFNTDWERREWIQRCPNIPLYEKLSVIRQYLLDKYYGIEDKPEFSQYPFRVFNIDIETEISGEFPDQYKAQYPINVISIYNTLENEVVVWCYKSDATSLMTKDKQKEIIEAVKKDYDASPKFIIHSYDNEITLLEDFLDYWTTNYPDIVTGWNTKGFDIPYIVNRLKVTLGENNMFKLSPVWDKLKAPIFEKFDKKNNMVTYMIQGISLIDYLPLYKKFAGSSKQSFKLDAIAKEELDLGKFDYYDIGYESMQEFQKKDFVTFVQYNMIDTVLVRLIDKKLGFINLMRNICNISLCEYEAIYQSIPHILGALTIQARINNVKFLTDANKGKEEQRQQEDDDYGYQGAFVFPTKAGYYNNGIMSFDFNSLYPNVMMTVNISPDTKVGKLLSDEWKEIVAKIRNKEELDLNNTVKLKKTNGKIIDITIAQLKTLLEEKCTVSANGVLYIKPANKFGIIPQFLDKMYKRRVEVKGEMKANKKRAKAIDEEIKQLEEQLKNI